jgi:hypothetical protein
MACGVLDADDAARFIEEQRPAAIVPNQKDESS